MPETVKRPLFFESTVQNPKYSDHNNVKNKQTNKKIQQSLTFRNLKPSKLFASKLLSHSLLIYWLNAAALVERQSYKRWQAAWGTVNKLNETGKETAGTAWHIEATSLAQRSPSWVTFYFQKLRQAGKKSNNKLSTKPLKVPQCASFSYLLVIQFLGLPRFEEL